MLEFLGDFDGKMVVKLKDDRYNVLDWVSETQGEIIDGIFVGALSQLEKYVVYVPAGKQQKETVLLLGEAYKQGLVAKNDIAKIAENEQKIVGSHGYYTDHQSVEGLIDEQVRKIRWAAGLFVIFSDRMDQIEVVSKVSDFKPHSQEFKQMTVVLVRDNAVASGSTVDETVDGVRIGSRKENEKFCLYLDEEPQTKRNVFTVKYAYESNYIDKSDLETIGALIGN